MPKKSRACGNSETGGSVVQSFIFPKGTREGSSRSAPGAWTKRKARAWAKDHGYSHEWVDEKPNTFRIRQLTPDASCEYRTIPLGASGVKAVVEFPSHVARALVEHDFERGRR